MNSEEKRQLWSTLESQWLEINALIERLEHELNVALQLCAENHSYVPPYDLMLHLDDARDRAKDTRRKITSFVQGLLA